MDLKKRILAQKIKEPLAKTIASIYEYKGKEKSLLKNKKLLSKLHLTSQEISISNFHKSFKKKISKKRYAALLEGAPTKNAFEEEMLGYRSALLKIHKDYKKIRLNSSFLLKLFQELYQFTNLESLHWKTDNNSVSIFYKRRYWILFKGLPFKKVPKAMDKLHKDFHKLQKDKEIETIFLIATYLFDFFMIHPFMDGNGRICRLILLLLLYQSGFSFARYVSLEKIIEKTHVEYYISLYRCTHHRKNLIPWWEYVANLVLIGYRELDKKLK